MRIRQRLAVVLAAALGACSSPDESPILVDGNEPNDTVTDATPIAVGALVPGAISAPGDPDYYLFTVPANGRYVHVQTFDANGANGAACDRVDTLVEVGQLDGTASGYPIAGGDNSTASLCAEARVWLPEGDCFVRVSAGPRSGPTFEYTVLVTFEPESIPSDSETEPNDTRSTANGPYAADALVSGTLTAGSDDYDYFAIENSAPYARTVAFATFTGAVGYCPSADTYLLVVDSMGYVVAMDDDDGVVRCAALAYQIPALTTYYVQVSSRDTALTYLLRIDFP